MLTSTFKLLAAALLLGACNVTPTSKDGYTFERVDWNLATVQVKVVRYQTLEKLEHAAAKAGVRTAEYEKVQAWSTVSADGKCTIHMLDPGVKYVPEFIGHELTHCLYGRFHV